MINGRFESYDEWSQALIKEHGWHVIYRAWDDSHEVYTKDRKYFVILTRMMSDKCKLKLLMHLGGIEAFGSDYIPLANSSINCQDLPKKIF